MAVGHADVGHLVGQPQHQRQPCRARAVGRVGLMRAFMLQNRVYQLCRKAPVQQQGSGQVGVVKLKGLAFQRQQLWMIPQCAANARIATARARLRDQKPA